MSVEVKSSKINGTGLFATRKIKRGETVLVWDKTKIIPQKELGSLSLEENKYLHPLDCDLFIIVQPPERFVNHSCDNNTEFQDFCDIAVRDIEIGEEITSNYETDGAGLSFTCSCGSSKCRGRIGADTQ